MVLIRYDKSIDNEMEWNMWLFTVFPYIPGQSTEMVTFIADKHIKPNQCLSTFNRYSKSIKRK